MGLTERIDYTVDRVETVVPATRKFEPSERELRLQMIENKVHVYNVEYCIHALNFEQYISDPDRPHDIEGPGNKLEFDVLSGIAMRYHPSFEANKEEFNKRFILPSVYLHRNQQYHHIVFRSADEDIEDKFISSGKIDWVVGAIDVICAQYENRACYGGHHSFDQIIENLKRKPLFKTFICLEMLCDIKQLGIPELNIRSVLDVPNVNLGQDVIDSIESRFAKTVESLSDMGYDRSLLVKKEF